MIFDTIENLVNYSAINKHIGIVINFINSNNLISLPEGKIELTKEVFAIISNYKTKNVEDAFIEYHKKYIDIHIVLSGSEKIGFVPFVLCEQKNFFEEQDYGELLGEPTFFTLKTGSFLLFLTFEGHMPQINVNENDNYVKKIVFKITQE